MPNTYFKFKEFIIYQHQCAMKVTTDACLFGAWIADILYKKKINYENILDIGAGTGLLTLMLAQKNPAFYHALEINQDAHEQCIQNFNNAKFSSLLTSTLCNAEHFKDDKKYQFIISNPPFFENDLKSPTETINLARHNTGLGFNGLLNCIASNLSEEGFFAILLPYHRAESFEKLAVQRGFFLSKRNLVQQTLQYNYFRSMLLFEKRKPNAIEKLTISIETERGKYSAEFIRLLKDYYLYL